jgi:GAF domain-containing protein
MITTPHGTEEDTASAVLLRISELAASPSIGDALRAAREFLDMDIAYATEHVRGMQLFRNVQGDLSFFGLGEIAGVRLDQTYCQRMRDGRLPNLIPDVRADDRAARLAIGTAASIRTFASVPLRFADGRFFGTFCVASHELRPGLGYRHLELLRILARIVADQFELDGLRKGTRLGSYVSCLRTLSTGR